MLTPVPKISIVIRCYNEERHIGRLLCGILEQTIQNVEIIIVDSGSTDATVSIASRYPVKIISIKPEEFSFGRALNMGCRAATGEIVVIASAHVYPVYRNWLEEMISPFQDPEVALVYGKQRGHSNSQYSEHQIFQKWFPNQSNFNQDHPFCNNANSAIRRTLWEKNCYDENLTGLEDLDWAKRIQTSGYKIVYLAPAEIVHVHDEKPQQIFNRYRREAIALKNIFPYEKFSFFDFFRLVIANILSDWYHARRDRVLAQNFWDILIFRLMQFWGTYRGFSQQGTVTSKLKHTFYYPNTLSDNSDALDEANKNPENQIEYAKLIQRESS